MSTALDAYRALREDPRSPARPAVQAARIEIALSAGDLVTARAAPDDLERLAPEPCAPFLVALAACGDGAVRLAAGDARGALGRLRRAWTLWQHLDAPYEATRCRVLIGAACRALGDVDAARMESAAARVSFERLGAAPDLAGGPAPGRLTPRECEILRLVATGATTRPSRIG